MILCYYGDDLKVLCADQMSLAMFISLLKARVAAAVCVCVCVFDCMCVCVCVLALLVTYWRK